MILKYKSYLLPKVLVCAHRYIGIVGSKTSGSRYGRGMCYLLNNELKYDNLINTCQGRSVERGHEDYGYCQLGTSASLLSGGTLIIGAPGPYNWRGTIFIIETGGDFFKRDKTQYHSPHTENNSPVDKYSYMGMATTGGRFLSDNLTYVGGAPRAGSHGQIAFFKKSTDKNPNLIVEQTIEGEQFGSSFGYVLLTADVNGDK